MLSSPVKNQELTQDLRETNLLIQHFNLLEPCKLPTLSFTIKNRLTPVTPISLKLELGKCFGLENIGYFGLCIL